MRKSAAVSELADAWAVVTGWIHGHAPVTYAALALDRADPDAYREVEHGLGLVLTDDLREWFGLHGVRTRSHDVEVFPGHVVTAPGEAVAQALMMRGVWMEAWAGTGADHGQAGDVAAGWHDLLVPFAEDLCGDSLVADLRAGPLRGRIHHYDKVETDMPGLPSWPSITALVRDVARGLHLDLPVDGHRPVIERGRVRWDPAWSPPPAG